MHAYCHPTQLDFSFTRWNIAKRVANTAASDVVQQPTEEPTQQPTEEPTQQPTEDTTPTLHIEDELTQRSLPQHAALLVQSPL